MSVIVEWKKMQEKIAQRNLTTQLVAESGVLSKDFLELAEFFNDCVDVNSCNFVMAAVCTSLSKLDTYAIGGLDFNVLGSAATNFTLSVGSTITKSGRPFFTFCTSSLDPFYVAKESSLVEFEGMLVDYLNSPIYSATGSPDCKDIPLPYFNVLCAAYDALKKVSGLLVLNKGDTFFFVDRQNESQVGNPNWVVNGQITINVNVESLKETCLTIYESLFEVKSV